MATEPFVTILVALYTGFGLMRRTITRRRRGPFGWVIAVLFWGFNALMVAWLISYLGLIGDHLGDSADEATQAGTVIGGAIGSGFLLFIWFIGDIILGIMMFFTRGHLETYEKED